MPDTKSIKKSIIYKYSWNKLHTLGQSKIVKSSYIWLFIIPVAAKLLSPFAGEHELEIFGKLFYVDIDLPFKWKLLFLMAILFGIGQAIYALRCPTIVRNYKDLDNYNCKHASENIFYSLLRSALNESDIGRILEFHDSFHIAMGTLNRDGSFIGESNGKKEHVLCSDIIDNPSSIDIEKLRDAIFDHISARPLNENVLFEEVRNLSATLRIKSLIVSSICFLLALLSFSVILIQNILFVIQFTIA